MFNHLPANKWKNMPVDARRYGEAFARTFGPSAETPLAATAEIGNEPGLLTDDEYRVLFKAMATGMRKGDPKLRIATCAAANIESGKYHKNLALFEDMGDLYDVITVHAYAMLEGWPTWKRSYPEDPRLPDYLNRIADVIRWRNAHAPDKQIWITEFGWDCSTKQPKKEGTFAKWLDVTDLQQAQYLVRSLLLFSAMNVDRAYVYFFDDKDEPSVHAASGVMRNGKPKPSFHALAQMRSLLGEYRFSRVVAERKDAHMVYEYVHGNDSQDRMWVAWSPTGTDKSGAVRLNIKGLKILQAHSMAFSDAAPASPGVEVKDETLVIPIGESPIYLHLRG